MTTTHRRPLTEDITCPYRCCGKATGRANPMGTQVFREGAGETILCEVCGNGIIVVLFDHRSQPRNPPIVRRRDPEPPPKKKGPRDLQYGGRRTP